MQYLTILFLLSIVNYFAINYVLINFIFAIISRFNIIVFLCFFCENVNLIQKKFVIDC